MATARQTSRKNVYNRKVDLMNPNHEEKNVGKFDLGFAHA